MLNSPRTRLILVSVALVVVIAAIAGLFVVPQFGKLADSEVRISEAETKISQAEALLASRQAAKDNAASTDAALLELASAVPENPDLPSLIIELQDVAYESNVQVRSITPDELTPSTGFVVAPLEVTIWGDWVDCVDFVQRLQDLSRQVRIVSADASVLTPGAGDSAVGTVSPYGVQVIVLMNTYVIPSAEQSTTAAPPAPAAQ